MTGISFMITQRQRNALRTRGLTDEEIARLTPEQAHRILLTPDRDEAERFLAALDPGTDQFTFQTFDDNKERREERKKAKKPDPFAKILHGTLARHWNTLVRLNDDGAGIFVTVNVTDFKGRSNENIRAIRAVFADLDGKPLDPVIAEGALVPHIITETSPDRFHAYWRVKPPETEAEADTETKRLGQFEGLQKAIAARYSSDPQVCDLPRVLRLPGFIHRKSAAFLSHTITLNDIEPYKWSALVEAFPPGVVEEKQPRLAAHPPHEGDDLPKRWDYLKSYALDHLDLWVPRLFPAAQKSKQGWRVSSVSLGRNLEEDISLTPNGIKDFGVHDLGDPQQGGRTAIDIVEEWNRCDFEAAIRWLCQAFSFDARDYLPPPKQETKDKPKTNGQGGARADEGVIPTDTMRVIRDGVANDHNRSLAFYNVVVALTRLGFAVEGMVEIFERHPDGIAKNYEGRVRQKTEHIYSKIKNQAAPHPTKQQQPEPISAEALEKMIFPPLKYIVPGILVEGLTLFASKPKMGKSWLLLHAAIAVATGGFTLGDLHCNEGDVLYCALEDSERRLKARMRKLGLGWPKRLFFWCKLARLSAGGLDAIRKWILDHPGARLIIIDILATVREARKREETTYDADYQAVVELRDLANEFGIAIVVVHHTRKADAEDAFDTVSGTLGLTGAPDSILIMKRNASGNVTLHGKGRDLIDVEKAMEFNRETCVWKIIGEAAAVKRSTERTNILNVFDEATEPIGPNDIAVEADMRPISVRKLLPKLVKEGLIEKVSYGRYQRAGAKPAAAPKEPPPHQEATTRSDESAHRPRTKDGFEVIGAELDGTPCSQCGQADGHVLLIRNPFRSVASEPLHEGCAQAWFAKPIEVPKANPTPR